MNPVERLVAGIVGLCLAVLAGFGWYCTFTARAALAEARTTHSTYVAQQEREARAAADAQREIEHLASRANTRITDEREARTAGLAARADALDRRLRQQAAAASAARGEEGGAACATGRSDAEPPLELPGSARSDLVEFARDAEQDGIDLRSLQQWITEVCGVAQ